MTVSVSDLATLANADADNDTEALEHALEVAEALVGQALEDAWREVPDAIVDECVRRTALNVFRQNDTNDNGLLVAADGTGVPGVANDPLRRSWDIIHRYTDRL